MPATDHHAASPKPNGTKPLRATATVIGAKLEPERQAKFREVFEKIQDELTSHMGGEGIPSEGVEWYKNSLRYNVPGGKLNRGMSVVDTAEILKGRGLNDEEYLRAAVLGWCIELLQAFLLVADDMMDGSITRRGQPCWYRVPKVGSVAFNDALLLEGAIYHLLKKYFREEAYYADLLDVFHETTYRTEFGQLVDLITAPEDQIDLTKFSFERHRLIVIFKTAFYSLYLPVACAMLLCGVPYPKTAPQFSLTETSLDPGLVPHLYVTIPNELSFTTTITSTAHRTPLDASPASAAKEPYSVALSILIPLGEYFQVQDDFLDYSAPPEILGKIGTDIIDNKCSWVINTALLLTAPSTAAHPTTPSLTPERKADLRKVLEDNYGKRDAEGLSERRVKEVYEELNIVGEYEAYEERVVGVLRERISRIEQGSTLKREVFESFLRKIYKRVM